MNVIRMRQEERINKINAIANSIETALLKGQKIDYNELVLASSANLGISKRITMEYVEVALFNLKLSKENLKNGK